MTTPKKLLKDFDVGKRTKIKLTDNNTLSVEGMGNIVIHWKNEKVTLI